MSAGDWKDMFLAACDGDVDLVRHHLENGVDANHVHPEFQSTALVAAILAGHEDVARLLLDHGADPGSISPLEGLTPLEAARQAGMPDLEARLTDLHGTHTGPAPDRAGGGRGVASMRTARTYYRLGGTVAVGTVLFLLFGIGALGIIGDGGPADLMYVGAAAIGLVGAVVARFRAGGMAVALGVTALATVLVGAVAVIAGLHRTDGASVPEILGLSGMYAGLYAVSAWLFRRSEDPGSPAM